MCAGEEATECMGLPTLYLSLWCCRCYAALGDVCKARYLHGVNKQVQIAAQELGGDGTDYFDVRAKLLCLEKDFEGAAEIYVEQVVVWPLLLTLKITPQSPVLSQEVRNHDRVTWKRPWRCTRSCTVLTCP